MHVTTLCRSLNFQLRNISCIRRFLDFDTCHQIIVRVLILSRLDYDNDLLFGSNQSNRKFKNCREYRGPLSSFARLQNTSMNLHIYVNYTGCLLRIKSPLRSWFFMFKCLNGMTPEYLSSSLSCHRPAHGGFCSDSNSTKLFVNNTTKTRTVAEKTLFLIHFSASLQQSTC